MYYKYRFLQLDSWHNHVQYVLERDLCMGITKSLGNGLSRSVWLGI